MPKYADPAVYPVGTPAATDNVMTRTAAGADGNFALGNLAGISGLTAAADLSLYYNGTAWATYTVTSVGRTLLAATTQAAQRTALGAADDTSVVHNTGTEIVGGNKTFSGLVLFNQSATVDGGAIGNLSLTTPGGAAPGFIMRRTQSGSLYRSEIRGQDGRLQLGANPTAGADSAPARFFEIYNDSIRSTVDNVISGGTAAFRFTQFFAANATIGTSDARLKTEPRQLRDAEFKAFSAVCRLPPVWRWLSRVHGDENCEPEGRAARKHFGPTVQAAMQVFADNGLDAFENAPFCYDEWEAEPEQWHKWPAKDAVLDDDGNVLEPAVEAGRELIQPAREAGDRYSFRKEELLCGMVSALAREIDEGKAENAELRGQLADFAARLAALEAKA